MLDARKPLPILKSEWMDCQECSLGVRRVAIDGNFIFGQGATGGIMFIGEGPTEEDAHEGQPAAGKAGELLWFAINKLNLAPYTYITHIVACRSCEHAYGPDGEPSYRKVWGTNRSTPVIEDRLPTPAQTAACSPRLHEEIYLVDPMLIVCLGRDAATLLAKRKVNIGEESGTTIEVEIPGAGRVPNVTEKRKQWRRKVKGEHVLPTLPTTVRYPMIPVLRPAYVLQNHADRRHKNPTEKFTQSFKNIAAVFTRLMLEVHGDYLPAPATELTERDIINISE